MGCDVQRVARQKHVLARLAKLVQLLACRADPTSDLLELPRFQVPTVHRDVSQPPHNTGKFGKQARHKIERHGWRYPQFVAERVGMRLPC